MWAKRSPAPRKDREAERAMDAGGSGGGDKRKI
jgi:hypothetical protein